MKIALIDNKSVLGYSAPGMEFLAERAFEVTPNAVLLAREFSYQYWQNLITPKSSADVWLKERVLPLTPVCFMWKKFLVRPGFAKELRDTEITALLHEDKTPNPQS